jgi:hypothetical protein
MKDETLSPVGILMEDLPIALPADEARAEAEGAMGRLVEITRSGQDARRDLLDWLRVEFGVEKPGQKLEDFAALDTDACSGYADVAIPVRESREEAARLKNRLSDELVNRAYGLTPEEVELLWSTAPPRMPGVRESEASRELARPGCTLTCVPPRPDSERAERRCRRRSP